jgi:NitT/TauT family transport system ATP-binding protein
MISALAFADVSKVYATSTGIVKALDGVRFAVAPGEFISVLGPSGCGKSTLMGLAAGLELPTAGSVSFAGREVDRPVTEIGIVFQTDVLLGWRRVLGNILLQTEMRGLDQRIYEPKARALLAMAGLAGCEDKYPHELSGGMRQRVSICRALIHDPPLLLMDEPFGALDALTREIMVLELHRLWLETRKSVLFITHDIEEAVFLADRVLVMTPGPGRIAEIVQVDLSLPRTSDTREDLRFTALVSHIRRLFERAGVLRHAA